MSARDRLIAAVLTAPLAAAYGLAGARLLGWLPGGAGAWWVGLVLGVIVSGTGARPGRLIPRALIGASGGLLALVLVPYLGPERSEGARDLILAIERALLERVASGMTDRAALALGGYLAAFVLGRIVTTRTPRTLLLAGGLVLLVGFELSPPSVVLWTAGSLAILSSRRPGGYTAELDASPESRSGVALGALLGLVALGAALAPIAGGAPAPLAGPAIELASRIGGVIGPLLPFNVGGVVSFSREMPVGGSWNPPSGTAFDVVWVTPGPVPPHYWRVLALDRFDGETWRASAVRQVEMARETLIDSSGETGRGLPPRMPVPSEGSGVYEIRILPRGHRGVEIATPGVPLVADTPVTIELDAAGSVGRVARADGEPYSIATTIRPLGAALAPASAPDAWAPDYPFDPTRYLDPGYALGAQTRDLVERIAGAGDRLMRSGETRNAAFARAAVGEFTGGGYAYEVSPGRCEPGLGVVECFLRTREGFCRHFATAMAVALRANGVPSRVIEGFLPGRVINGREVIENRAAHAWVQVWVEGLGWTDYDPTPIPAERRPGAGPTDRPDERPSARPSPTVGPSDTPEASASRSAPPSPSNRPAPPAGIGGAAGEGGGAIPIAAIALAGLIGLIAVGMRRRRADPERSWRTVLRWARLRGVRRGRTETPAELAERIARVAPDAREELRLLSGAKERAAYGRGVPDGELLERLPALTARVRRALLRPRWGRRPPGGG